MIELNSTNNTVNVNKLMSSTSFQFESAFLGRLDFQKAEALQGELYLLAQKNRGHFVLGLEHPAVLTLGYRANQIFEVYPQNTLPIQKTSRGGLATVHSEGQLIIYPIINLRVLNIGVRDYVRLLMLTTQGFLTSFGIKSYVDDKAVGVYTAHGKLAFCGIQIKGGITQHGISLNVRNDLSLFDYIRPCGCEKINFDSLSRYDISHTLPELYQIWSEIFRNKIKTVHRSLFSNE